MPTVPNEMELRSKMQTKMILRTLSNTQQLALEVKNLFFLERFCSKLHDYLIPCIIA